MSNDGYIEANRLNWDDRARLHARGTTGYRLDRFREDRELLSDVVDFDKHYLGDITGLRVLHLQCHIGTDTLSLARLGANVVGLDQSGESLRAARELFASVDTAGTFVESTVYDAVSALDGQQFDLLYTGVGSLNWLPDIDEWGRVVSALIKPGGHFYIREGHPMAYALDDTMSEDDTNQALRVKYPYFQTEQPLVFDLADTYVDTDGEQLTQTRTHEWNHGIGEVFTALTSAGLTVTTLEEHKRLDWRFLPNQIERDELFYLPEHQIDLCPVMYTIAATKPT